ncbi:hypothetical protein [Endozoicomonas euniceicola]|uniref:Uncharacterized protein n=1 Tax=Endozoicomonas euniceicola TaxID=1234143 RepID=A0ABY6GV73_9GAMM|nr:hypothetical protein [Endozoicomonas euniceicola]UYM15986.1 hypothetical protein NX720_24760 [Endozoicomonas euniceicola]
MNSTHFGLSEQETNRLHSISQNLPNKSIDELRVLHKNAVNKLDTPSSRQMATALLNAVENELERRNIPGMIATFEKRYPGGFYGDLQAEEERNYKVHACQQFQLLLGNKEFEQLIRSEQYDELYERVTRLVGLTNFIQGSFEKPILLDTIRENQPLFMNGLFQFLWSADDLQHRFDQFVLLLEKLGLKKWTYITYFLFLSDPEQHMFVKPEMLKRSLDISGYPVRYESTPSFQLYNQILNFSHWLKSKISPLKPRDMIDVHSFMWHMAPTGKHRQE